MLIALHDDHKGTWCALKYNENQIKIQHKYYINHLALYSDTISLDLAWWSDHKNARKSFSKDALLIL